MALSSYPCRGCTERKLKCHVDCQKYKESCETNEDLKKIKKEENQNEHYILGKKKKTYKCQRYH